MATLKFLKTRIQSIKSTQKITSAMKLVASSHFKKAENKLETAAYYTALMDYLFTTALKTADLSDKNHPYFKGRAQNKSHLFILVTGNRGLCGGYNVNVTRKANSVLADLSAKGQHPTIIAFGNKAFVGLKSTYHPFVDHHFSEIHYNTPEKLNLILEKLLADIERGTFQSCSVLYTSFRTVMSADLVHHSLIPFSGSLLNNSKKYSSLKEEVGSSLPLFDTEPQGDKLIDALWKEHLKSQIYFAICESLSSEHSARMISMDNATKNAKEMLNKLELLYNKTRQASITKELIEIVAGSESI